MPVECMIYWKRFIHYNRFATAFHLNVCMMNEHHLINIIWMHSIVPMHVRYHLIIYKTNRMNQLIFMFISIKRGHYETRRDRGWYNDTNMNMRLSWISCHIWAFNKIEGFLILYYNTLLSFPHRLVYSYILLTTFNVK